MATFNTKATPLCEQLVKENKWTGMPVVIQLLDNKDKSVAPPKYTFGQMQGTEATFIDGREFLWDEAFLGAAHKAVVSQASTMEPLIVCEFGGGYTTDGCNEVTLILPRTYIEYC